MVDNNSYSSFIQELQKNYMRQANIKEEKIFRGYCDDIKNNKLNIEKIKLSNIIEIDDEKNYRDDNVLKKIDYNSITIWPKKLFLNYNLRLDYKYTFGKIYESYKNNSVGLSVAPEDFTFTCDMISNFSRLINDLRERDIEYIEFFLDYMYKKNNDIVNIIIMLWSLPEKDTEYNNYFDKYKENIQKYNHKLIKLINTEPIKNFCKDVINNNYSTTSHTLDIIWYYLQKYENNEINFIGDNFKNKIFCKTINGNNLFIVNMKQIIDYGLGNVKYNDNSINFQNVIKYLINDEECINIYGGENSKHYETQRDKLINMMK